jgi:hypothetical protein
MKIHTWQDYLAALFSTYVVWAGYKVLTTPAKKLLEKDNKLGYVLFTNASNKESGLRRATIFYKVLGTVLTALGLIAVIGWVYTLVWR